MIAVWDNAWVGSSDIITDTMPHGSASARPTVPGRLASGGSSSMDGCIEFQGARWRRYGSVRRQGRTWRAHRWAWTEVNGPIPAGLHVLHRCDNPPCVNVDHLFLGTPGDNARDRAAKDRGGQHLRSGDRNGMRKHPESVIRGSRNANAKLTEADIPVIRARLAAGESVSSVMAAFGVNRQSIHNIASGNTWKHVQ